MIRCFLHLLCFQHYNNFVINSGCCCHSDHTVLWNSLVYNFNKLYHTSVSKSKTDYFPLVLSVRTKNKTKLGWERTYTVQSQKIQNHTAKRHLLYIFYFICQTQCWKTLLHPDGWCVCVDMHKCICMTI